MILRIATAINRALCKVGWHVWEYPPARLGPGRCYWCPEVQKR